VPARGTTSSATQEAPAGAHLVSAYGARRNTRLLDSALSLTQNGGDKLTFSTDRASMPQRWAAAVPYKGIPDYHGFVVRAAWTDRETDMRDGKTVRPTP